MVDLCQFDVCLEALERFQHGPRSDCQQVGRGGSCQISCRLPYSGMLLGLLSHPKEIVLRSTAATCPMNNTDALQGLQVNLPQLG